MQTLHLLIEDDFIEEFVNSLPRKKVTIIEKEFDKNKQLLANELENYKQNQDDIKPYTQSKNELDEWLKQKA